MEALVTSLSWSDWPENTRDIFQRFRSDRGEDLILQRNPYIAGVLPNAVIRNLTDSEMDHDQRPFLIPEDRRVMLNWSRKILFDGEPAGMVELLLKYSLWFEKTTTQPKLFINADLALILVGNHREYCAEPDPIRMRLQLAVYILFRKTLPSRSVHLLLDGPSPYRWESRYLKWIMN